MIENTRFIHAIATTPHRAVRGAATRLTTLPLRIAIAAIVVLVGLAIAGSPVEAAGTTNVKTCDESHLDAAVTAAPSGGTVSFSCDGTITLTHTIAIAKTLTLDGSGHAVTLSGGNAVQLLQVTSSGNLTVNHLTLTAGNAWTGGAIENEGNLTVSNSAVTKNAASFAGGAIYADGPVTVTNSAFNHNSAGSYGGAITANYTLSVATSALSNNSSGFVGGAIEVINSLSVTASAFDGNHTTTYGGAINYEGLGTAAIGYSIFTNNVSSAMGGAIENSGVMSISNSVIGAQGASNSAPDGYGGGIDTEGASLSLTGTTIAYNTAAVGGGINDFYTSLAFNGSTIKYNTATSVGGGVYITGDTVTATSVNTTFSNNAPTNCDSGNYITVPGCVG